MHHKGPYDLSCIASIPALDNRQLVFIISFAFNFACVLNCSLTYCSRDEGFKAREVSFTNSLRKAV